MRIKEKERVKKIRKEMQNEKNRIASLLKKLNRKKKYEERFAGRKIYYYLTLKDQRQIKDSEERTMLIAKLMECDKLLVCKTSHLWKFQQWDAMETRYLRWAWDLWGEKAYLSIS